MEGNGPPRFQVWSGPFQCICKRCAATVSKSRFVGAPGSFLYLFTRCFELFARPAGPLLDPRLQLRKLISADERTGTR